MKQNKNSRQKQSNRPGSDKGWNKQSNQSITKNQDTQQGKEHDDSEHPHEPQMPTAKPSGK